MKNILENRIVCEAKPKNNDKEFLSNMNTCHPIKVMDKLTSKKEKDHDDIKIIL